jgi:hypothetical protein
LTPPTRAELFLFSRVCRIVRGLDLREPLHAGGVNLGDPALEGCAPHFVLDVAIPEGAFKGDELPLLESVGELRENSPGKDAMPLGAGFVIAFVVLQAFLAGAGLNNSTCGEAVGREPRKRGLVEIVERGEAVLPGRADVDVRAASVASA